MADSTRDDDGYLADLGLRGRVGDAVELEGGVRYTDFSDGGDDTALVVGGRFHFNKTWALGAEYSSGDDCLVDPRLRARELLIESRA